MNIMAEEKYVAAIEISSSKVTGVVGKYHPSGSLEVVAAEQERGNDSVCYGIVRNVDEVGVKISRILQRLENRPGVAPKKISGVFLGLSGISLRSIPVPVSLNLPDDEEVTDETVEKLLNQARTSAVDASLEMVDAVPRVFKVGNQETLSPKGIIGNQISAEYDLVVCRKELKRNLSRVFEEKLKNPVKIQGIVVTALATGQMILTEDEKRLGCMLVDMGAETTTVTIYKNGHLKYFTTLPMGGRNITRDITSLNLVEKKAEDIKIASGNALPREAVSTLNYNGVKDSDVSNLIVARAEEIIINILKQIRYAGLKESDIPGGIVCIGGAAKLNGILDLLNEKSGVPVRRGSLPKYILVPDLKINSYDLIETLGVLYAGASQEEVEESLVIVEKETLPVTGGNIDPIVVPPGPEKTPKRPSVIVKGIEKSRSWLSRMFSDKEDDSASME